MKARMATMDTELWDDNTLSELTVMTSMLDDADPVIRKQAATMCIQLGWKAKPVLCELLRHLTDPEVVVRIALAEAVYKLGENQNSVKVLNDALRDRDVAARLQALHVLEKFGYVIEPALRFVDSSDERIF